MNNLINNQEIRITSIDLCNLINQFRLEEGNTVELLHKNLMASIRKEIEELESELVEINDKLFGEAATDYMLAAELDDRRITVEDRLMQLYEEEENTKPLI